MRKVYESDIRHFIETHPVSFKGYVPIDDGIFKTIGYKLPDGSMKPEMTLMSESWEGVLEGMRLWWVPFYKPSLKGIR